MATKYLLQNLEGETLKETSKKQTAINAAEKESLLSYRVVTSTGTIVHEVVLEDVKKPKTKKPIEGNDRAGKPLDANQDGVFDAVEEPDEDLIGETPGETHEEGVVYHEHLDFPGNYSITMAPFAAEIADAAGVPTLTETFAGKLTRRVYFGGDKALATKVKDRVEEEAEKAKAHLHQWQKENIENRRGLTDMQRYLQHRNVLENFGRDVATTIKKAGL